MRNIKIFDAEKYVGHEYHALEKGIYEKKEGKRSLYVMSLSFVQDPELGEGKDSLNISQYPLEDILDKYYCYISDFYEEKNSEGSEECCLEFASDSVDDVINLKRIIGKHVYNSEVTENGKDVVKLIIE